MSSIHWASGSPFFLAEFGHVHLTAYGNAAFLAISVLLGGLQVLASCWVISLVKVRNKLFLMSLGSADGMRRRARFDGTQRDFALYAEARINKASLHDDEIADEEIEDDRLRLVTCCHPALPPEGSRTLPVPISAAD